MSDLVIRPATFADLDDLADIWRELMSLHETFDARFALADDAADRWQALASDMLGREDGCLMTAEHNDKPVGFCLGWVAQNPAIYKVRQVGFISEIAVRSGERRQGVGRALVASAVRWFEEQGLAEFQLSTAIWNEDARRFWQSLGGEELLVRYRFELSPRVED